MLARHRHPRVAPLEVWDVVLGGEPLHTRQRKALAADVAELIRLIREGSARRTNGELVLPAPRRIERAVLTGGASADLALPVNGVPVFARPELAATGGRAVLRRLETDGLVVDFGQSRLKAWRGSESCSADRDFETVPNAALRRARPALVDFSARFLREAAGPQLPKTLVLALPCEVADDGALGGCSYPWAPGDRDFVPELLRAAGFAAVPTYVLNDAELAAIGLAEEEGQDGPKETALVLTLGFGVGGALVLGTP